MNRSILINIMNEGVISFPIRLLHNYHRLGLTEKELMLLIHVHSFLERGNSFPTPDAIADRMSLSSDECYQLLRSLLKRGFLDLQEQQDEEHIFYEAYSLLPLWDKLVMLVLEDEDMTKEQKQQIDQQNVYQFFEQEFGRPLSPMEFELITMWLDQDQYDYQLIKAALMEAVISGKRNLRYIDRILIEWHKNGVRTVQEAKAYGEKFRKHQYKNNANEAVQKRKFPNYDWLEGK